MNKYTEEFKEMLLKFQRNYPKRGRVLFINLKGLEELAIFIKKVCEKAEMYDNSENERIQSALDIAWEYGQIDGSHHRLWVIDQMVRALCGNEEKYKKWVGAYTEPLSDEDGDYYEWDTGIAP